MHDQSTIIYVAKHHIFYREARRHKFMKSYPIVSVKLRFLPDFISQNYQVFPRGKIKYRSCFVADRISSSPLVFPRGKIIKNLRNSTQKSQRNYSKAKQRLSFVPGWILSSPLVFPRGKILKIYEILSNSFSEAVARPNKDHLLLQTGFRPAV